MAHPKHRISKERKRRRRSHHALTPANLSECPNCGEQKLPHHACNHCGYYRGRTYIGQEAGE